MTTDVFAFVLCSYVACHMFLEFRLNVRSVIIHDKKQAHVSFSSVNWYKLHIHIKKLLRNVTFGTEQFFFIMFITLENDF